MTIHPELPWNVAGIAPEAREAARASARREGLSVSEWLTRRDVTPQKPQKRPRERDLNAIRRWQTHTWPRIQNARAA